MDTGLDQNQVELGVLVLAVLLEVLSDGDRLLDQVVEVFGQRGRETVSLQDAEDFGAGDRLDLADAVRVTEDGADVGRGQALLGELADNVDDLLRGDLQPGGGRSLVGEGTAGDALAVAVHATHLEYACYVKEALLGAIWQSTLFCFLGDVTMTLHFFA